MTETNENQTAVVRTNRGLSVAGTRITLYQIMDYVKADRPPSMIREHFRLTVKQTADILQYIKSHREEVEAEYQQVLAYADENRRYWEKRKNEHFEKIKSSPPLPGKEQLYAKLRAAKKRLGMV
jgi:hypothetical protein